MFDLKSMEIVINKNSDLKEIDKILMNIEPHPSNQRKIFKAEKYLGKLNWGEDALQFQKKMRDEWN
jgi:hypothetical protein